MRNPRIFSVSKPSSRIQRIAQVCLVGGILMSLAAFNRFNHSSSDDAIGHFGFVLIALGLNPIYPFYQVTEDIPRSVLWGLVPFWLISLCFVGSNLLPRMDIAALEDYGGAVAVVYAAISLVMIYYTAYRNDENFTEEGLRR